MTMPNRPLDRLLNRLSQKEHNPWAMLALGIVVGFLALTLVFKLSKPIIKSACVYILESDQDKGSGRQSRVATIEGATVTMGTMTKRIASVGNLKANASVTIRAEMPARIKELPFTEGGSVKAGQDIIRFEDADAQADMKQAEAQVLLAKADFDRVSKLHDQKIGSVKEFDKGKAELAMAEARLDGAKAKLDKTVIKASFEGTIGLINVSPGAYVQAAQELVTIVDTTPIKVEFKVPEKHVHDIGVGQTVEVRTDAFKDKVFHGIVDAVDAQIQSESHSISVRAAIPNESGQLRPGLFGNVSLIIGEQGEVILIDEAAVDREGEIEFVWIVEKGKAGRRRILTGTRENGKIEVIAGLKPGQIIVTAGQLKLGDGIRVKITNMPELDPKKAEVGKGETVKTTEEVKPDSVKPDPAPENKKVEDNKSDETKVAETKAEDSKPAETKDVPKTDSLPETKPSAEMKSN